MKRSTYCTYVVQQILAVVGWHYATWNSRTQTHEVYPLHLLGLAHMHFYERSTGHMVRDGAPDESWTVVGLEGGKDWFVVNEGANFCGLIPPGEDAVAFCRECPHTSKVSANTHSFGGWMPQTLSTEEQKMILDLTDADWDDVGQWAARGDARLIAPPAEPDGSMTGYCSLAYTSLVGAFLEVQALARRDSLDVALVVLARLARSPWLRAMAEVLGQPLEDLLDGVAQRLASGRPMVFEALEQGGAASVGYKRHRGRKSRKLQKVA